MAEPDYRNLDHWRQEQTKNLEGLNAPLQGGGPGGTSGGMEARLAKVEAALEHIGREMSDVKTDVRALRDQARTDFRLIFAAIIAVALGLAGLLARGFHWL